MVRGSTYRIQVDASDDAEMETILEELRQSGDVEFAERDAIISVCTQPNDTQYGSQWALEAIKAAEAWEVCRDTPNILVAVPDTGVDYNHRDLRDNLWFNEAELLGLPGVDDDRNGYVDDIRGYDFISGDADPFDDNGHGTHCAGIVGARTNNGLDIAGVSWNATILPLKMLGDDGEGPTSGAVEAIYYAVSAGADVISCSWGDTDGSQALRDAVAYAYAQGVILVAAAGNKSSDTHMYPAAYPEVIGVAATDAADNLQRFSNFGTWVDVAAPGEGIVSLRAAGTWAGTSWNSFLTEMSGTSMATPHVSGACALLLCAYPSLTPDQLREVLLSTADPIAEGICVSNGRLNVGAALRSVVPLQGKLAFDRQAYADGGNVVLRLTDRDLIGLTTYAIRVTTRGGDAETVMLREVPSTAGIFSGSISSGSGVVVKNDGRIQAADGDWIVAEYLDEDDGQGNLDQIVASVAVADYTPPVALETDTELRGSSVWVTVVASEPVQTVARFGLAGQAEAWLAREDELLAERHRLSVGPLVPGLRYGLEVVLTDAAGNETIVERDTTGEPFDVEVDPNALLVPSAYDYIQDAIDAAEPGQTVWVADGTYSGIGNRGLDLGGKAISVRSENGPQACTINGRGRNYAFVFRSGEGHDAVIEGFTVTDCGGSIFGGAVQCLFSSPTIADCVFRDNMVDHYGGAIYCLHAQPAIRNCTFTGNSSGERGGALYCDASSDPTVEGCTFRDNTSKSGAAVAVGGPSGVLLQQCLFFSNVADLYGAAVAGFDGSTMILTNCTISRNEAGLSGSGLWCDGDSSAALTNSIVWGNTLAKAGAVPESPQIVSGSKDVEVNYSCVQGWSDDLPGTGSFDLDPLFADPEGQDFHLRSQGGRWNSDLASWVYDSATSPCVDAGDPAWPLGDEPTTASGTNVRINLGAFGGTAEASRTPSD